MDNSDGKKIKDGTPDMDNSKMIELLDNIIERARHENEVLNNLLRIIYKGKDENDLKQNNPS